MEHARARLADVLDAEPESTRIDEAVVTYFAAPNSYTSEDVVEIAAHGSPVVLELLLRRALDLGARLAEPGEFTQRAFLAGRIDLTQAEAVRDLIEAQTLTQARLAASQMGGALSHRVAPVKQSLVELIALLEAGIDFAEDDVDVAQRQKSLAASVSSSHHWRLWRHPLLEAVSSTMVLRSPSWDGPMPARARSSIGLLSGTAPL